MARIQTQLCKDAEQLQAAFGPAVATGGDAVVLFSLGLEPSSFVPFAKSVGSAAPVLLADCYGILGFAAQDQKNLELMEAGRGQEYGGAGGDGGQGVVAVAFSGGFEASTDALPAEATSHLAVSPSGGVTSFLAKHGSAPYYGGVAKETFRFAPHSGEFERVPHFFVSTQAGPSGTVGTTSFTGDPKGAVKQLLDGMAQGYQVEAVALMPCFMRGKNMYDKNNVEPDAVAELLPGVPIFGMFCHGELGPKQCLGFDSSAKPQQSCRLHSMTSIVAIHASKPT